MKKQIKTLFIVLIVILTNNSCVELEEKPFGLMAPENFYKTEADFEKAEIGIFYLLCGSRSAFDSFYFNVLGYGSDDHEGTPRSTTLSEYNQLKVSSSSVYLRIIWGSICYGTIANMNAILGNIGNAEGISDDKMNEFEGHARFIRALCYFYLTRYFGEIPIIDEHNFDKADQVGQSPVDLVYDFIIEDLKLAENKLAVSYPLKGQITRGAAKTLLAKVYLTRACWPLKDVSYYALARDKAKEVMDLGIYELEPVFADLWLTENKLTLKESIFSLYSNAGNGGRRMQISLRPGVEGGWGDATSEADFFYGFPEGPRKEATFHTTFIDSSSWEDDVLSQPYCAKQRDGGSACGPDEGGCARNGEGFSVVLRYADVLLVYAEAANMAEGGPSAQALEAINQVRRRAGGFDQLVYPDLPSGMSQADFDKAVIDERGWELTGEVICNRWFDMIRKELVVEIYKEKYPYVTIQNQWMPKPVTEVQLIDGLDQNEGYD